MPHRSRRLADWFPAAHSLLSETGPFQPLRRQWVLGRGSAPRWPQQQAVLARVPCAHLAGHQLPQHIAGPSPSPVSFRPPQQLRAGARHFGAGLPRPGPPGLAWLLLALSTAVVWAHVTCSVHFGAELRLLSQELALVGPLLLGSCDAESPPIRARANPTPANALSGCMPSLPSVHDLPPVGVCPPSLLSVFAPTNCVGSPLLCVSKGRQRRGIQVLHQLGVGGLPVPMESWMNA